MHATSESIRIAADGGPRIAAEELDTLTRRLRDDLLAVGVPSVDLSAVAPPERAKSGISHEIGVLVASGVFSASMIKAIGNVVASWIHSTGARSVLIELDGDQIEISGATKAHVDAFVEQWLDRDDDARGTERSDDNPN